MNRSQLAQATALFWRHLRPALTDPAKFVGLAQRIGQIFLSKGISGAIKHHAPGTALYADYAKWIIEREPAQILKIVETDNAQPSTPIISVLLLSEHASAQEFPALLKSLLAQNCAAWELIVDARLWERHANPNHPQVHTVDTSAATGSVPSALSLGKKLEKLALIAAAPYVHIYLNGQFRLDWVAQCAQALEQSSTNLLYWDHDLIDAQQLRHSPNFKPQWNPELLLSQNYIGAAWLSSRDKLLAVLTAIQSVEMAEETRNTGVFSLLFYQVLLEIAFSKSAKITHLANMLSHHSGQANFRALVDTLNPFLRTHEVGFSHAVANDHAMSLTPSNTATPRVSIIIPTRDGLGLLQHTISSLQAITAYPNYEIVIADNDSTDPATCAYLNDISEAQQTKNIRVIKTPGAFNFSKINNIATEHTEGELLLFLNNDVEIIAPNWLNDLVGNALNTGVGAVGCMLLFPNRTIQHAGIVLGLGGYAKHVFANQPEGYAGPAGRACSLQQLSAVTAACLMVQRVHFNAINGFDERYAVAFNDVDLCLRLSAAGLRNIWTPNAVLLHHESASRGYDDSAASQSRFLAEAQQFHARWDHQLSNDPFYNPNLTLTGAGFALGWEKS